MLSAQCQRGQGSIPRPGNWGPCCAEFACCCRVCVDELLTPRMLDVSVNVCASTLGETDGENGENGEIQGAFCLG